MKEIWLWLAVGGIAAAALVGCETTKPEVPAERDRPEVAAPSVPVKKAAKKPVEPVRKRPVQRGTVRTIDLESLFALMNGPNPPLLYDARLNILYRMGHLPGAVSLPVRSVKERFPKVREEIEKAQAAGRKVVFYCIDAQCPDAANAAGDLAERGIDDLFVYEGGIGEWKAAGMPVE